MRKKKRATLISILFLSAGYGLTLFLLGCSQRQVQGQAGKAAPRYEVTDGEMEKTMLGIRAIKGNPRSHYRLAQHYQERSRHHEAIREFRKALSIDPEFYNAYVGMGVSYDKLENYQSARAAYRLALKLKPDSADVLNNMGYSAFLEGSYDEAVYLCERAVSIDGKNRRYHNNLGKALLETGDYEQALSQFLLGVEDASAYYMMGRFFYDREEYSEAERYFSQAVKINPDMKGARKGLLAAAALADIKGRPSSPPAREIAAKTPEVSALPGVAEKAPASAVPIDLSARLQARKVESSLQREGKLSVTRPGEIAASGSARESRDLPAAGGSVKLSGGMAAAGTAGQKNHPGANALMAKKMFSVDAKGASNSAAAGAVVSGDAGKTRADGRVSASGKAESAGAAGTVTASGSVGGTAGEGLPAGGTARADTTLEKGSAVDVRASAALPSPSSKAEARHENQVAATGTAGTADAPSAKGSEGRTGVSITAQGDEVSPAAIEVVAMAVESGAPSPAKASGAVEKDSGQAQDHDLNAEQGAAREARPPAPAAVPAGEEAAAVESGDDETAPEEKASVSDSAGARKEDFVLVRCHVRQEGDRSVTVLQYMSTRSYHENLEIEVVNESGSGEITEGLGGFPKEQGFRKVTVMDTPATIQKKTKIYYRHDYLQPAFRVAKDIPGYQDMSGVESFESSEAKIRVVIGSDMKRYASFFQRQEEYAYTAPR